MDGGSGKRKKRVSRKSKISNKQKHIIKSLSKILHKIRKNIFWIVYNVCAHTMFAGGIIYRDSDLPPANMGVARCNRAKPYVRCYMCRRPSPSATSRRAGERNKSRRLIFVLLIVELKLAIGQLFEFHHRDQANDHAMH